MATMTCPKCPPPGEELRMASRSGIEIDYCPKCRGVWLDRGELDKLLEREAQAVAPRARPDADFDQFERDLARRPAGNPPPRDPPPRQAPPQAYRRDDDDFDDRRRAGQSRYDRDDDDDGGWDGRRGPRRRKEGLLSEIFDIFGD
jgi:Zn-finger nucleic acid-binding protein